MKTIHKFLLNDRGESTTLRLREGYRVVRCEYLVAAKGVYLWVEQSLKPTVPMVERQFLVTFSGDPVPEAYGYLDTALDPFGPEAYHVFELPPALMHLQVPDTKRETAAGGTSGYHQAQFAN